jgi:hypothetical protein
MEAEMLANLWFRVCIAPAIYIMLWEFAFTGGPFRKASTMWEARFKLIGIHTFAVLVVYAVAAWWPR